MNEIRTGIAAATAGVDAATVLGLLPKEGGNFMSYVNGALSFAQKGIGALSSIDSATIPSELLGLLDLQRQMAIEMESVSLISNIEQARHESKMAAIRNVRMS